MEPSIFHNNESHKAARFMNNSLHLEPNGEIINLDYNPMKLYNILQHANDGDFNDKFYSDINQILQSYITLRRRVFKIARSNSSNDHFQRIRRLFNKYHITDQIDGERHMPKAITLQRLMLLFPHLVAKIVTTDLNVESIVSSYDSGLSSISPACFWKSSFCLLPKYKMDVADADLHMKIIKAMLLAQYERHEVIHEHNEHRNKKGPIVRMQAVVMNCTVIYNSDHVSGKVRWAAYKSYFFADPIDPEVKYDYEKPTEVFDKQFSEINSVLQNIFQLKSGTGVESG